MPSPSLCFYGQAEVNRTAALLEASRKPERPAKGESGLRYDFGPTWNDDAYSYDALLIKMAGTVRVAWAVIIRITSPSAPQLDLADSIIRRANLIAPPHWASAWEPRKRSVQVRSLETDLRFSKTSRRVLTPAPCEIRQCR